jgi:MFS family permease
VIGDDVTRTEATTSKPGDPPKSPSWWRTLGTTVLLPNFLYGTGQGSLIPIVPLFAHQLGASLATAALVAAMLPGGQWLSNIPAGWLVGRIGERRTIYVGAAIACLGAIVCWLSISVVVLSLGVLMVGSAAAVFNLARQSFVTVAVPLAYRGRGMSLLGGANRGGVLVGPFLSATVIKLTGDTGEAFAVGAAASLSIIVLMPFLPAEPTFSASAELDRIPKGPGNLGIWATFKARHDVLLRVATSVGLINFMRTSRQIIVPLVGLTMGLHAVDISLVVGIGAVVEFGLFYLGGQIMDRFGRLWTAIPSMAMFAISHGVLAVAPELIHPFGWYVGASMLMAVGNGITSGVVAAMGSDLADQRTPAAFLSAWRSITDLGPAAAPFVISGVTAAASLAAASGVMGGVAVVGAVLLLRYVPRYLPKRVGQATSP